MGHMALEIFLALLFGSCVAYVKLELCLPFSNLPEVEANRVFVLSSHVTNSLKLALQLSLVAHL